MASFFKRILTLRNLSHLIYGIGTLAVLLCYASPFIHPESIPIIPFFGLAYPLIILAYLGLLIIAVLRRTRWAWVIGAVILIGIKLHFRTIAWSSGDAPGNKTEIQIMSYNVKLFDRYNEIWDHSFVTKDSIFAYLKSEQPDIICFQEFYHQDEPTTFVTKDSILDFLKIKDSHERFRHKVNGRQNFGVCMMSKYPMIEKGYIKFNNSTDLSRNNFCIYADIKVKRDTIRVYNVHLQSIKLQEEDYTFFNEDTNAVNNLDRLSMIRKIKNAFPVRANQAEIVTDHIRNSPYPVVVCGDFNDTPLSYCYNQFNSQLTDAFRNSSFGIGQTYTGTLPAGRIDYIFHSPEIGSNSFKIQEKALSDHLAISCKIFIK